MSKQYRLALYEVSDHDGAVKSVLYDDTDSGYYISHVMRSLAKKVYEPAPVVKLEGQEVMDL